MNNLAYGSQDAATIGAKVEELVRADVAATEPLAFRIEQAGGPATTLGTLMGDAWTAIIGGKPTLLFSVVFDFHAPRAGTLEVHVDRQGIGCHAGVLAFSSPINKPVAAEISLENPKFIGKSKFIGDPEAAAKLNADNELVKRANKFSRTEGDSGGMHQELPRCFKIVPAPGGAQLVGLTLPRMTKMGMSASTDAGEFLEIAAMIEKAL